MDADKSSSFERKRNRKIKKRNLREKNKKVFGKKN